MVVTYTTRTVKFTSMNGITYSMNVLEASSGVRGRQSWQKWYECYGCSFEFPESQTVLVKGRRYGVPCGCYRDEEVGRD